MTLLINYVLYSLDVFYDPSQYQTIKLFVMKQKESN